MSANLLDVELVVGLNGRYGYSSETYATDSIQKIAFSLRETIDFGTSAEQADIAYFATGSADNAAGTILDLAGSLADKFGNTLIFKRVTTLLIQNLETTAGRNLQIGGNATNAWSTMFDAADNKLILPPRGIMLLHSILDTTGYVVTAGTGDKLLLESNSGVYSVNYGIGIIGRSA